MNTSLKEQDLCLIYIFCNIINVFWSANFFKKKYFWMVVYSFYIKFISSY